MSRNEDVMHANVRSVSLSQLCVVGTCRMVPGGLYGSPSHGGVLRQGGDRAAATRR